MPLKNSGKCITQNSSKLLGLFRYSIASTNPDTVSVFTNASAIFFRLFVLKIFDFCVMVKRVTHPSLQDHGEILFRLFYLPRGQDPG